MVNKKCLIVCGPTAIGKSDRALELAIQYNTSIISADSRQCYKELNIGVAKPSTEQLQQVPHYFINSHSIHHEINVKVFEQYALAAITDIFKEKNIAIMVGGTGLYLKAFAEGLDEMPEVKDNIRNEINDKYLVSGMDWLKKELESHDPLFFSTGESQNPQRALRALEVKLSTGKSILEFQTKIKVPRDFEIEYLLMDMPREILYQRINSRVDNMLQEGLLEEVKSLYPFRHLNALQTVGYRELFEYLEEKISLEKAVDAIKKNSRHYAKRQMTWFRKFTINEKD